MSKRKAKGFAKGSGGGGRRKPPETAVSGTSTAIARVLGLVSEGEIEGLAGGLKDVFLDETPIQNADDSFNFKGFGWDFRPGTQGQSRIPGFADEVATETNVGAEVKFNLPITRTFVNANLDIIRVRVGVVLQEFPSDGGVLGLSVSFRILIKEGAGAFEEKLSTTISGRYPSLTEFDYAFPINNLGGSVSDFSVRVERLTAQDADESRYQRQLQWRTFTQATEAKLSYPNSSLFAISFDVQQFQSLPQIALRTAGRKIQIPSSATPTAQRGLTYSDIWDGTFITPSTAVADPAWTLYDLVTNTRYGLGRYINQSQGGKWTLYEISQYCNEYVDDGYGGTEHRFLCHANIEGKSQAYQVIQQLLSIFRGFSYWSSGAIAFAADMPGSPVAQFTQSDVEDGLFSYTRTGLKSKYTIAMVEWTNPDDFFRRTVEVVEDPDGISKFGVRELELSAFACTSRGQARRAGMAALLTNKLETETVTFRCRAYGTYTKPGDIIRVMDSKRADIRYGGLIAAATTTTVTLDNPVALEEGETYTLSVLLADGTVEQRTIANSPEVGVTTLSLQTALSTAPPPESNWILASTTVEPELFRVINRVPTQGTSEMMHEITAVAYDSNKFGFIEQGWTFEPLPPRQTPPVVVNVPGNIVLSYRTPSTELFDLYAAWDFPLLNGDRDPFITSYFVELRMGDDGLWTNTSTTNTPSFVFNALSAGKYYTRVVAIDLNGKSSRWVESSPIVLSKYNWVATFTSRYTSVFAMEF